MPGVPQSLWLPHGHLQTRLLRAHALAKLLSGLHFGFRTRRSGHVHGPGMNEQEPSASTLKLTKVSGALSILWVGCSSVRSGEVAEFRDEPRSFLIGSDFEFNNTQHLKLTSL